MTTQQTSKQTSKTARGTARAARRIAEVKAHEEYLYRRAMFCAIRAKDRVTESGIDTEECEHLVYKFLHKMNCPPGEDHIDNTISAQQHDQYVGLLMDNDRRWYVSTKFTTPQAMDKWVHEYSKQGVAFRVYKLPKHWHFGQAHLRTGNYEGKPVKKSGELRPVMVLEDNNKIKGLVRHRLHEVNFVNGSTIKGTAAPQELVRGDRHTQPIIMQEVLTTEEVDVALENLKRKIDMHDGHETSTVPVSIEETKRKDSAGSYKLPSLAGMSVAYNDEDLYHMARRTIHKFSCMLSKSYTIGEETTSYWYVAYETHDLHEAERWYANRRFPCMVYNNTGTRLYRRGE